MSYCHFCGGSGLIEYRYADHSWDCQGDCKHCPVEMVDVEVCYECCGTGEVLPLSMDEIL